MSSKRIVCSTATALCVAFFASKDASALRPNLPSRLRDPPSPSITTKRYERRSWDPLNLIDDLVDPYPVTTATTNNRINRGVLLSAVSLMIVPSVASATTTGNVLPSAFAAYGHYLSILGMVGCVITEKVSIKPNMNEDEEFFVLSTDTVFGVFGILMLYTGYLRATAYEKGFDFYSHEPIFWMKLLFVAVFAASSLFNTTVLLKRNFVDKGKFEPIGEQLSARMDQICNAELTALALIPLTATFMARGVLYNQDIPWEIEAAVPLLVFGGLSLKYITEAINFDNKPAGGDINLED